MCMYPKNFLWHKKCLLLQMQVTQRTIVWCHCVCTLNACAALHIGQGCKFFYFCPAKTCSYPTVIEIIVVGHQECGETLLVLSWKIQNCAFFKQMLHSWPFKLDGLDLLLCSDEYDPLRAILGKYQNFHNCHCAINLKEREYREVHNGI